MERKFTCITTT